MATSYPLLFTHKDLIAGNGFFAHVECSGRVLLTEEDRGFWMGGVTPGSLAAGGVDRSSAFRAFKENYLGVLFDIAAEAPTFEEFEAEVSAFMAATNEPTAVEWDAALEEVRTGSITLDLPRSQVGPPSLQVTLIRTPSPEANAFDSYSEAA